MSTSFKPLEIRRRLGRETWGAPEPFGPDGWRFRHRAEHGSVIITCADRPDDPVEHFHASMAFSDRDPTYVEMAGLARAVWPDGYSYMVFAPPAVHVNIHEHALHLWGRRDGAPLMREMSVELEGRRSI